MKGLCASIGFTVFSVAAVATQSGLDPAKLLTPGSDSWPTYNGDYSGRRYSALTHINETNVKALSLAWIRQLTGPVLTIKSTPLMINGVLYISTQDNAYAIDARAGRELWHYVWPSKGGNHLSNRGMGALGETLYFETPDCHLVALDMKDGKQRWNKEICNLDQFYYGSVAPVVIKNHVITGVSGDDMDNPGYLEAHDPTTGERQWRWYTVPQTADEAGSDTWPNLEAAKHGGGMTWQPVTYDPELNLLFVTTGNPQPVIAQANRPGDNLFTGSIVALNADTGKMVWYFQSSPHDTHDWDSNETPVLIDGVINGQPRKLIAQAARNGHFFVLDRASGKAMISTEFVKTNWSLGYDKRGQPIPNPAKIAQVAGTLVSPNQGGATNWFSPSFSPKTGLFYVNATRAFSVYYIYDPSDNPAGWGGTDRGGWSGVDAPGDRLQDGENPLEPPLGQRRPHGNPDHRGQRPFTGGSAGFTALNATTGDVLWVSRLGNAVSNGPITYELDGLQYVVVGAGNSMAAFVLNK